MGINEMKKEPIYVLLENPSPDDADGESVRRSPRRSKCRWPFRKPKLPETAILALLIWGIAVLGAYDKDLPGLGGSEEECEEFYIPPDQESNSLHPYSNTFNVTGPIDWSKSGGSNSLDRFRAIGPHNSYHVQQYEGSPTWWASWWASFVKEWAYEHPSLIEQLNSGWRTFELDFHMRPKSVSFYHVQMWDQLSTCTCYHTCLKLINDWSDLRPRHFPLYIMIEPKTMAGPVGEDSYTRHNEITLENLLLLEQQILNIFGEKLVTPDALRNGNESVLKNIRENGMPDIEDMLGKIFFLLWDGREIRDMYRSGTEGLKGRGIFTTYYYGDRNSQTETPFLNMDGPNPTESKIA